MMTETGARYPFIIMNTNRSNKKGRQWWSSLIYIRKKKFFYLIVLALKDSRNFCYKTIVKL